MLNEEERKRLDTLQEMITVEIQGIETYNITLGDIKWLADKLVVADEELKKVQAEIDRNNKVEEKSSLQVGSAFYARKHDIADRWYPR